MKFNPRFFCIKYETVTSQSFFFYYLFIALCLFSLYPVNMPRLFISVNCNDKIKKQLLTVQEKIRAQSVKGSFSRPENLHLTLVFIGEIQSDKIPLIASVIDKALNPPAPPFTLTFSTVGCFTHSKKELWWIGTDSNDPSLDMIRTIRRRIADGLSSAGICFDNRPFNPHITLGREVKHDSPIIIPKQEIIFPVNRISLMKSERIGGILTYTEIYGAEGYCSNDFTSIITL